MELNLESDEWRRRFSLSPCKHIALEPTEELLDPIKELLDPIKELLDPIKELLESSKELLESSKELLESTSPVDGRITEQNFAHLLLLHTTLGSQAKGKFIRISASIQWG